MRRRPVGNGAAVGGRFLVNAKNSLFGIIPRGTACRELQRIDAVAVHDAVEIDVADVAFRGELRFHLLERGIEQLVRAAPEHCRTHLARGRTNIARKIQVLLLVRSDLLWT